MHNSGTKANAWLRRFLLHPKQPHRQFGRLVCLIAICDFELSLLSLSRVTAHADEMVRNESSLISAHGRRIFEYEVPELARLVERWKGLRTHELDEASLWNKNVKDWKTSEEGSGSYVNCKMSENSMIPPTSRFVGNHMSL